MSRRRATTRKIAGHERAGVVCSICVVPLGSKDCSHVAFIGDATAESVTMSYRSWVDLLERLDDLSDSLIAVSDAISVEVVNSVGFDQGYLIARNDLEGLLHQPEFVLAVARYVHDVRHLPSWDEREDEEKETFRRLTRTWLEGVATVMETFETEH
jgi:hypothetical protein